MKLISKLPRISSVLVLFLTFTFTESRADKSSGFLKSIVKSLHNNICTKNDCIISRKNIVDDESFDKTYKWPDDPECSNLTVNLAKKGSLPGRALVSFPGSGNTWLRHLIESSTGLYTTSIYKYEALLNPGYGGRTRAFDDGRTILQKTHYFSACLSKSDETLESDVQLSDKVFGPFGWRGILLIRNPYDAILAEWNHIKSGSKVNRAKKSSFSGIDWRTYVEEASERWRKLIQVWFEKSKDLHVVLYEELKAHTERELIKIHQYLRFEVDPLRIKCTMKYSEGPFHRKQQSERKNLMKSIYKDKLDMSGKFTLESIVQNHVDKVNKFFLERNIPLELGYKFNH